MLDNRLCSDTQFLLKSKKSVIRPAYALEEWEQKLRQARWPDIIVKSLEMSCKLSILLHNVYFHVIFKSINDSHQSKMKSFLPCLSCGFTGPSLVLCRHALLLTLSCRGKSYFLPAT